MENKKKVILIVSISIIVLVLVAGLICFFVFNGNKEDGQAISKLDKLYQTLQEKDGYSFNTILDDNNKMYYAKQGDKAYIDTIYQGNQSVFIIKDGNSYLVKKDEKRYYTYTNNETDLEKVKAALESIKDENYEKGNEKIENKNYSYEEYAGVTTLLMDNVDENVENAKTRFYFDGNKLAYIKTIIGDKQELLKVDISYKIDNNLFEIPTDYTEN